MLLLKNINIIDPTLKFSGINDILIEDLKISNIARSIESKRHKIIDGSNLYISAGFIDIHCHLREPGFTYKEDIESGGKAALAGGFTVICPVANTKPPIDNETLVRESIKKGKLSQGPTLFPFATISKGLLGKEIVDVEKLKKAGAISFTDDGKFLQNVDLLKELLLYSSKNSVRIALHEEMPNQDDRASEYEAIERDLKILEKIGGKIHIMHVSTKESVKLIEHAKRKKLDVTCEVTTHHLVLSKHDINKIGTNAKVNPPLRDKNDIDYLQNALKDGLIDCVATDHAPHSYEDKNKLYNDAPPGILSFQTALPALLGLVHENKISLARVISSLTIDPARIFDIEPHGKIEIGGLANLTIFDLNKEYKFSEKMILSKSKNSPFLGRIFKGGVKATIHEGNVKYLSEML